MKRIKDQKGFTLVELLVALVVGMFVLAATIGLVTINQRSHFVQEQIVDAQQNARIALDMMARDLKMAGYDPRGSDLFATSTISPGATSFTIVADFNENGALDPDETVTYTWQGDTGNASTRYRIIRQTNEDPNPVAITPPDTIATFGPLEVSTPDSLSLTRVVLGITARTVNEDPYFAGGTNVTGTANDGTVRTRTLTTAVTLRNL